MTITEQVEVLIDRLGAAEALDRVGEPLSAAMAKVLAHPSVKDVLSGKWLGHPLHPVLTDIPIGAWTSAFLLDLVGGERCENAADLLVAAGVVSALPTAATGMSDWCDTWGRDQRVGLAHAAGNILATAFYGLSYLARRRGDRERGVALGLLGATAATAGAYLGGHLSFRRGVNVDRNAWKTGATEWQVVAGVSDLRDGEPLVARAGDEDVMVVRQSMHTYAVAATCGHAGGPLQEGVIDAAECVKCPWHGSVFRLRDGAVVHGPATGPQPAYDVKVEDGMVAVRRRRG